MRDAQLAVADPRRRRARANAYGLQSFWRAWLGVGTKRYLGLEANLTGYLQRNLLTDIRDPSFSTSIDPLADDFHPPARRPVVRLRGALVVGVHRCERHYVAGWSATLSWNPKPSAAASSVRPTGTSATS